MEKEGIGIIMGKPDEFKRTVMMAKQGDKDSMNQIINFFTDDIEYLSRYIKLPKEDAIQSLKMELVNIVFDQL